METREDIHDSRYSWQRLCVTLAIGLVANVGMWAIIVIMPSVEVEFGAGRAEASLPYTLTMVGFGLGNLLIGRLLDRFGVTRALIGAAGMIAAGFSLSTLMPSISTLAAAHLLLGLDSQ